MKYIIKSNEKTHGFTYAIDSAIEVAKMITNSKVLRKNKIDGKLEVVWQ